MLLIYVIIVCLLGITAARVASFARVNKLPPFLTSTFIIATVIYCSCLLPGVFGILYTSVMYSVCAALCLTLIVLIKKHLPASTDSYYRENLSHISLTVPEIIVMVIGLLGSIPLLAYFRWNFPTALRNPDTILGWDTVSYHLPGFVEFLQKHTLWSLDGPYQSYSFAFELIGNFLSHPFHTHWGLVFADAFSLVLLIASFIFVISELLPFLRPRTKDLGINSIPYTILAIGIWTYVHSDSIGEIGKNDIFTTGCLVAAFGFLLRFYSDNNRENNGKKIAALLSSIALGLALGTKPSAIAFIPLFAFAIGFLFSFIFPKTISWQKFAVGGGFVVLTSLILGGFWLIRNIIILKSISPFANAWELSLIANIGNPALYEIKRESILFILGLFATIPCIYLLFVSRRYSKTLIPISFLLMFHLFACGAFSLTPHAIFHQQLQTSFWKLRLGMPLFVSASVIYSLATFQLINLLSRRMAKQWQVMFILVVIFVMILVPIYWQTHQSYTLPGYESIKDLPKTNIYTWINTQTSPLRIYSAGLRPYGLYGKAWENILFYDLHSTKLEPIDSGIVRIAAVVIQFRPDLIVISVDPHSYSGKPKKPAVIEWIREQTNYFQEVYSDETVSAFHVNIRINEHFLSLIPQNYKLSMSE